MITEHDSYFMSITLRQGQRIHLHPRSASGCNSELGKTLPCNTRSISMNHMNLMNKIREYRNGSTQTSDDYRHTTTHDHLRFMSDEGSELPDFLSCSRNITFRDCYIEKPKFLWQPEILQANNWHIARIGTRWKLCFFLALISAAASRVHE